MRAFPYSECLDDTCMQSGVNIYIKKYKAFRVENVI